MIIMILFLMVGEDGIQQTDLSIDIKNLQFENENLRKLLEERNETISQMNKVLDKKEGYIKNNIDEIRRLKSTNVELLSKINKLNSSNMFDIEMDKEYFIDIPAFKGVVTIVNQTNDFIKYITKQNKTYFCNKAIINFVNIVEEKTLEEKKYD